MPTISLQTAWYLENWPQFYFWVLFVVLQTLWFGPVVGTHLRVKNCQCGNYDILELYLKHDFLLMSRSRVKEYLPITGLAEFNKLSAKLIFGADRYFLWDISTHVLPLVIFMSHLLLLVIFMVNCEFLELKSNNIKFLPTWLLVFHICLVTLESWLCFFFCIKWNSPAIQENRVATVQFLSGTGSLRVGGEFLARHYHKAKKLSELLSVLLLHLIVVHGKSYNFFQRTIYIPQPTCSYRKFLRTSWWDDPIF
jgi:hypothetical protein